MSTDEIAARAALEDALRRHLAPGQIPREQISTLVQAAWAEGWRACEQTLGVGHREPAT